jgi:hypothetical protein
VQDVSGSPGHCSCGAPSPPFDWDGFVAFATAHFRPAFISCFEKRKQVCSGPSEGGSCPRDFKVSLECEADLARMSGLHPHWGCTATRSITSVTFGRLSSRKGTCRSPAGTTASTVCSSASCCLESPRAVALALARAAPSGTPTSCSGAATRPLGTRRRVASKPGTTVLMSTATSSPKHTTAVC